MAPQNTGDTAAQHDGKHAAAPKPLTKREQRRAQKAAQRAAEDAAKQAKKAAKAADKASRKGGGVVAPAASATAPIASSALKDLPSTMPGEQAAGGYVPVSTVGADQYSRYNTEQLQVRAPKRKKKRGGVVAAILIVLAIVAGAGFAGANIYLNSLNQNLAGDAETAEVIEETLTPVSVGDDPFYMLLLGCDDREGVDGARSDTTILARIDPTKNKVTLLSIPRDTAIKLEGRGLDKFNAAYTYGGTAGTIEATKKLCGIEIAHYAEVHFEALIDIIDYIGGVDVDVPIAIDDVDAGGKVDAGMQHLDGEHAMIFARSRSYLTGDFQRTTSQRLLIEAAVQKVLAMNPTEYPGLLMKVSECMTTDLSVQELLGLAQAFTDEPEMKMYSAMVPSTTEEIDGVSYVITDEAAFAEMMKLIDSGKNPAKLNYEDSTVKSSKEAKKEGLELIINYGDDAEGNPQYGYEGSDSEYGYDPYAEEGYDDGGGYDDGSYDDGGYEEDDEAEYEDYDDGEYVE